MGVAVDVRSIAISVSVCLSVCRHFSITTCPKFAKFSVHVTCGRSLTAMQYVIYFCFFLYMASCFHVMEQMGQNQRRRVCFIQFARWWHQLDIKQRCLVEFTSWQHRLQLHIVVSVGDVVWRAGDTTDRLLRPGLCRGIRSCEPVRHCPRCSCC